MADNKREVSNIDNLTIKVNVDFGDTITDLKRLQREAREATKAVREFETNVAETKYKLVRSDAFNTVNTNCYIGSDNGLYIRPKEDDEARVTLSPDLAQVPTEALKHELAGRADVESYSVGEHGDYQVITLQKSGHIGFTTVSEPALLIVDKSDK